MPLQFHTMRRHSVLTISFVDKGLKQFVILSLEASPLSRTQITLRYNNSFYSKYSKGNERVILQGRIMLYSFYFSAIFQYQLNKKKQCCTQKKSNAFKSKKSRSIEIN